MQTRLVEAAFLFMMKKYLYLFAIIPIVAIFIFVQGFTKNSKAKAQAVSTYEEGFAVLELFTSQGCSSCPPADKLLGNYAKGDNERIIAIAFHVDYWNSLGWKDPFSKTSYSERQKQYADLIDGSSVYTPQLVINGQKEFVGSDAVKTSATIKNALNEKPIAHFNISQIQRKGSTVKVNFQLDKIVKNSTVHAILLQQEVSTHIKRGENSGIKLTNYNVVRDLVNAISNDLESSATLSIPSEAMDAAYKIVLLLQDNSSGKIIAAKQKAL